jgi:ABC-type transport system substrate-binding protein
VELGGDLAEHFIAASDVVSDASLHSRFVVGFTRTSVQCSRSSLNMSITRRRLLGGSLLAAFGANLEPWASAFGAQALPRGGTLVIGAGPELTSGLTSAVTSAGTAQLVSGKIFDGLMTYDQHFNPKPQLATHWQVAADGLSFTFHLRSC